MEFISSNFVIIALVVGTLAGFVGLYMHQKKLSGSQLATAFRSDPRATVENMFNTDRDYLIGEIQQIRERLDPKPFPSSGATFVDLFDVGEQYGLSGTKQGVVLDDKPVRTGIDPAIVLRTVDGRGISRIS